jgi:LysR family nitrogen assimilation transcriptional regulator
VEDNALLKSTPIYDEEMLFVTSIEGMPSTPMTFSDVLGYPLVLPCSRDLVRKIIDRHCEDMGLKLQLSYEVNSPVAIRTILLREPCSTLVPFGSVADDIRSGRFVARRITDPAVIRRLSLVRPANGRTFQQDAAIVAFMHRMAGKLAERVGVYMHSLTPAGSTRTSIAASQRRHAVRAAQ